MKEDIHKIGIIPGDLNGKTVTNKTLEVVKFLNPYLEKKIEHTFYPYNVDYFKKKGISELGELELNLLKKEDQLFLGAIGDPHKMKPGIIEIGLLLKLRQSFDQYVNLRPIILPEGVPSIIVGKTSKDINFEICRENTEGLYVAKGEILNKGTNKEIGTQIMECSYKGVKRLFAYSLERAKLRNKGDKKPTIHIAFKNNVLIYAASPWNRVMEENKDRKDVDVKYIHIDNFGMQMITNPAQFDVVITENMFGDIMTDLGGVIQGGIGSMVSGNINPTGKFPGLYEPVHGSAPDKWYGKDGKVDKNLIQLVKPEAAFLAYSMMLENIGENTAANLLKKAAHNNIKDKNYRNLNLDKLVNNTIKYIQTGGKNV